MRKQHGVLSLILVFLAIAVGTISIAGSSKYYALIYIIISLISFLIVVFSFCAKCPCRQKECGHVLPGKLTKILPERVKAPYNTRDYCGVLIPLLLIIAIPQFWLVNRLLLLVVFWVLMIIALLDIGLKVCKGCGNKDCPLNGKMN